MAGHIPAHWLRYPETMLLVQTAVSSHQQVNGDASTSETQLGPVRDGQTISALP